MKSYNPKFKTKDWHRLLLKIVGLQKIYNHFIVIEGINVLRVVSKKRPKNHKLNIFCNSEWFEMIKRCQNKIQCLLNFDEWYSKKFVSFRCTSPKTKIVIEKEDFSYSKKLWVSIGVDNYDHCKLFPPLKNAVNDSNTLNNFALRKGFKTIHLKNSQCSKTNLEMLIQADLCTRMNPDDLLVISFHGHGFTGHYNNKEYGFIVPYAAKNALPASLISMELLSLWVQMLPCRHVLLVLDCCFSGMMALRSGQESPRDNYENMSPEVLRRSSLYKNLCKKARIVINAGQEDEAIMDGGWNNNSLLTGLIVSYEKYNETNGSVYSLFNYISEKIPTIAHQNPTLGKLPGDMGGDIFLTL